MNNKPQKFTHAVANLNGKEYVIPTELSDKAVRKALLRIVGEAELAKRTVHDRVAFADRVMQIVAEELSD